MKASLRLLVGVNIFWLALSMLSDGVTALVLPDYLLDYSSPSTRATVLGLLTAAGLLFALIIQPFAGMLSDQWQARWGRHGTIGVGVGGLLLALSILGAAQNLLVIALGYLLIQGCASVIQAAQQGFIPDLIPTQQRGQAAGIKSLMDIGGALVGFLIFGQLIGEGKIAPSLLAVALAILIAYALTLLLVHEPRHLPTLTVTRPTWWGSFQVNWREHPIFTRLIMARFLFLLGAFSINRFLLYFVADRLEIDRDAAAEEASFLLAALTGITVLAAPFFGWSADRVGRGVLMVMGGILAGVGALLLIIAQDQWSLLAFGAIQAIGTAAFTTANWAMTTDVIPRQEAARFMGLANIGTAGGTAVAGLLGPLVDAANQASAQSGYTLLFSVAGAAFFGSAWVLRGLWRSLPTPSPDETP